MDFARDEGAFFLAPLVDARHATVVKFHPQVHRPRAYHAVQVGDGIHMEMLVDLLGQFPHSSQAFVAAFHVHVDDSEVGRRIDHHGCRPGHRGEHKLHIGVGAAHFIDHWNGQGHVAQRREAHHEHATGTFLLFITCHKARDL